MDTDILWREFGRQAADVIEAVDMLGDAAEIRCDKALFEQHMHDGEQQGTVGARARSDVAVGQFGCAGARRIDHGELATALRSARSLPGKSAAVVKLPLDTRGFAPMITR